MSLHLIKLCVGADSLQDLAAWQAARLKDLRRKGRKPELVHVTRQTPRRGSELLDGGSLYWVIKGKIAARQRILALRPVTRNGVPHCAIVCHRELVSVLGRTRRAFQGWRYLDAADAPPDIRALKGVHGLPDALKQELASLGLL